jgi:hypothetical protein
MLATISNGRKTRLSGLHSAARFYRPGVGGVIDTGISSGSSIGVSTAGSALALSSLATAGIGAAVSLAASGVTAWLNSIQLSHQADTATTQIVNGLEPLLRANVAAFQAGPMTQCSQQVALAAFDQAWQWLTSASGCGNGAYGSAGNACITDRSAGGRWPWASYYRDPIATASVAPNTACPGTSVSGSGTSTDLTNDQLALLPGGGSTDQYFALLAASGQANNGVGAQPGTTSTGPSLVSSLPTALAGLSTGELLLGGLAIALGLYFMVAE